MPQLTPRQRVVLVFLIEARDKDEIARLLHISPHTAKDHIKAIYEHFQVSSHWNLSVGFALATAVTASKYDLLPEN